MRIQGIDEGCPVFFVLHQETPMSIKMRRAGPLSPTGKTWNRAALAEGFGGLMEPDVGRSSVEVGQDALKRGPAGGACRPVGWGEVSGGRSLRKEWGDGEA